MIYILHGENTFQSYSRLQILLNKYKKFEKIKLDNQSSKEDYLIAISSELFENQKIVICENFIHKKKISLDEITKISQEKDIIFWEKGKINLKKPGSQYRRLIVEEFKKTNKIYYILDSISTSPNQFLKNIQRSSEDDYVNLSWLVTNRIYLLILARLNSTISEVEKFTNQTIQGWQWQKIISQASKIEMSTLKKTFKGLLKIDYMKKNSLTSLNEKTLISILFLKYFRS